MKNILIIGANGKVGRQITEKLKEEAEFTPVALLRKESQKDHFDSMGVESRVASLEDEKTALSEVMRNIDGVVFTAGSGPDTGYDKTMSVDLDGAIKSMEAAKDQGIRRFVMVSALNTGNKSSWEDSKMKPYYIAKYYADEWLKNSGLEYTIMRPGRLMDDPGEGKVDIENPQDQEGVPREDVASMIVEVLKNDSSKGKIISFNQGEKNVKEAVEAAV